MKLFVTLIVGTFLTVGITYFTNLIDTEVDFELTIVLLGIGINFVNDPYEVLPYPGDINSDIHIVRI